MSVVVIMPAFNEAGKIGDVLAEMPVTVAGRPVRVVVVDDGSSDGTDVVAREYGAEVLRQPRNRGKGAALRRGLEHVEKQDFEALLWMDADGQHLPGSIAGLAGPVLEGSVDMCVGSRYLDVSQRSSAPLNRRLVRRLTIRAIADITGCAFSDPFSGFRCFSPRAIAVMTLEGAGYESELEATLTVARAGLSAREVPIPRIYGPGTSKMAHRGRFAVVVGYFRTIRRARQRIDAGREAQLVG